MSSLDRLVSQLIEAAVSEEKKDKAVPLNCFKFERLAKSLVAPSQERAAHHRKREEHYTEVLEKAEKKLKEEGISMEAVDPRTGLATAGGNIFASGNIQAGVGGYSAGSLPKFQPKIDQNLLGDVERSKTKMLEHRDKAERYEKYARAFTCCPSNTKVELTVEDVHFFQLEN